MAIDLSGLPDKKEIDFSGIPDKVDLSRLPDKLDLSNLPDKPTVREEISAAIPDIVSQIRAAIIQPPPQKAEFTPEQIKAADGFVPPREGPDFRAMEPAPVSVGDTPLTSTLQPGSVETMPFKEQEEAQRQLAAFQAPVRAVAEYKPEFLQNLGQKVLDTSKSLEQANPTGSPMEMARQTISGLDALVGSALKGATVLDLGLIFGPMVAKEALEVVKTTNWFRKLTVPERGLVLSKFPTMELPDEQLLKVFKESPEGVQKAMAIHNPRMRQILQTGESRGAIETPLPEPVAAPEAAFEAKIAKPVETPVAVKGEAPVAPIQPIQMEGQYAKEVGAKVEGSSQEVAPPERPGAGLPVRGSQEGGVEAATGEVAPPIEPPAPPAKPLVEDGASGPARQRGFLETVEKSGGTTAGLKEQTLKIDPQEYRQLPNADVLRSADEVIAKKGTVKALADVMAVENPSIEDTGVAIRLMKIYEGREDYDKVIPLIDKFDAVFRKSGRTIQLASLWNSLSPSGFVKTIDRTLGKMKVVLDDPFKEMLVKNMSKIKAMPDGPEKAEATFGLLNSVYDKVPFGAKLNNWIDAYRYSNMLSNPLTHARNLFGNTFQTFVTRPLDMVGDWSYGVMKHPFNAMARDVQLADIPKYYQSVFKTIPEASSAFLDTITSNKISSKVVESPNEINFVNEAMRERLPKALKVIPGMMEASDRFFSVMVASGEKARLMAKGMSESMAEKRAKELAEKLLYRQQLGDVKKGDVPHLVKALDELGALVLSARKYPVIGKPLSWFAPFITTPINIAKASIERSPLGFIGGKYDDDQMGKALVGSVVALIGASAAMAGRVVWMPPKGEKERKAFYDSGRTPMSVEIGGRYIPAWYFGPYAISFMLPEAFRYQMMENPQRLTSGNVAAISKAILASGRLITEQTPMAGIKDLTNIMTGRETVSSKILARPASQMIPFVGALRFIANVVDPIYRKSTGFIDELKKSIPGLTKDLEAYKKLDGTPSTRGLSALYFPYSINPKDPRADMEFRDIQEKSKRRYAIEEYQRKNKEAMGR